MQTRIIFAALLATTLAMPAFAQAQEDQRAEPIERGDISRGTIQDRGAMRAPPERIEVQRQSEPSIERREPPVVMAAPPPPSTENRGWRGNDQRRSGEIGNTRREDTRVGNYGGPRGDRDGDGRPNWRDRDRDGDGIRDNRDWDRNNNGRVDGRWDRDRNGVVDRRWDQNRDGVRDNRRWNDNSGYGQNWGNQNWNSNQRWNRDWRNDRRYDWQRYRYSNRDLFRQPRYYSPYGNNYRYQRFGIGIYLESILFGSRYRISDPWRYRLPDAQWPYEWIRYHDDVLLVDTRNGYVVDVIYEFFW